MAGFTRHLQPAKASVAALALLGLALSPGSTLELHRRPSAASMQQTLMMYPSADEPLVFAEETPGGFDDKAPLVPQGDGEDLQQPEGPLSPQEEGLEGQQKEAPVSPQEERQPVQQQAPKKNRAARFRARLRRAALFLPRQLQRFYHRVRGGTRNLWERVRKHFTRRGRQQPEKPKTPETPEQPETPEEPEGVSDEAVKRWRRWLEEQETARPQRKPRGRSASLRMRLPEFPPGGRRRTASVGGAPRDISSPWETRPRRVRAASLGAPLPLEAPLDERRRAASVGSGLPADLSSPWPAGTGEGKGQGEGGGEGESPRTPSTEAEGGVEEGAAGGAAVGGEERGGGAPAAAPKERTFPVYISPVESPLVNVVLRGEFLDLAAKADLYPYLFRVLFLAGDLATARRLATLLPANKVLPKSTVEELLKQRPGVMVDGAISSALENLYAANAAATGSLSYISRSNIEQVADPEEMEIIDNLMKKIAAIVPQLTEAQTFWQAKEIFGSLDVNFPSVAQQVKPVLPFLVDALRRGHTALVDEGQKLEKLIKITKALVQEQTSVPFTNTYIYRTLIPALNFLGGRTACDWIELQRLGETLEGLSHVAQGYEGNWSQEEWVERIVEVLWSHRSAASVADKPMREACLHYQRRQGTQNTQNFPWFANLPHFTKRTVVIE
ncbi:hypothetical protein Emed_004950 [Eimeria media]